MNLKTEIKSLIKQIPGLRYLYRLLSKKKHSSNSYEYLQTLSNDQLLSLMRHESHRIEKTIYNDIFQTKYSLYYEKWLKLNLIYKLLEHRDYPTDEPTIVWSKKIYDAFDDLENSFIRKNSLPPLEFNPALAKPFVEFVRTRRSVRVWADEQPEQSAFEEIAYSMIDAAKWAPTSGNRQPWRFLILSKQEEKDLLRELKEKHCTSAPLLVFVGMDSRLYGAFGSSERSIYIDAGAAIMQMVLAAHKCGLGVCWNHFADDLISSREVNKAAYANFAQKLNIPSYIAPIAVIAIGVPKFIPPEPARMEVKNLLVNSK